MVSTPDLIAQADRLFALGDPISHAIAGRMRTTVMRRMVQLWDDGKNDLQKRAEVLQTESLLPVGYQTYLWARVERA